MIAPLTADARPLSEEALLHRLPPFADLAAPRRLFGKKAASSTTEERGFFRTAA